MPASGGIYTGTGYYGDVGAFHKKSDGAPKNFFNGLIDDVRIPGATNLTPGEDPDNPGTGWVRWSDPPNSNNWYWHDVFSGDHDDAVANWTLPAGTYTLEVAYREDGALLDIIVISKID